MKKILITLSIALIFSSCSSEIDTFDYDPKYLIEIDFKTGQVKEGGNILEAASPEIREICIKFLKNENLPEGCKVEILCQGSGGKNALFYYLKVITQHEAAYILITQKESETLVHVVNAYEKSSCLKRWIKN
ncbi:Uncharacterised protein [Chryseobacterium nakagawai]|uniref:Lipoprotein n=1 Tax=Chryseobacterium nakagawai TaxID=1241982 RepID=A0AAD0YI71_CHRNA|nr:hypothetical protein [Chryseobacterium nakagawai]AZA91136.1 hypothetical protein EG343_11095 [Chryseobacterium nakagawai]VEH22696.1 Uncharacterised protein [Chryseobacterium nakagawai]